MVSRLISRVLHHVVQCNVSLSSPRSERGQAFTLEAFVASLVLLSALIIAFSSTTVTPLTASTSNPNIETQQAALVDGLLESAVSNGSLRTAVLFWNETSGQFYGAGPDGDLPNGGPSNEFGHLLNRTLGDRRIVYNVNVRYVAVNETVVSKRMVHMGQPSDSSIRSTKLVTLYDNDRLFSKHSIQTNTTLTNSTSFYAPDVDSGGPMYNVIQVEVIAWRV